MSVVRTRARIANEHLFHGVDYVVYTEGGPNGTEVSRSTEPLFDRQFWEVVFGMFASTGRFYIKPVGSKANLVPIAALITKGEVTTALACMDRDYDHIQGVPETPGVFYTFGYSWENDVWSRELIEDLFYTFCDVSRVEVPVAVPIREILADFGRCIKWFVYADMLAVACGLSIIPRDKFRCVQVQQMRAPAIDRSFLRARVREANVSRSSHGLRLLPKGFRVTTERDTVGHLFAYFCFHVLSFLVASYCGRCLRKDEVYAVAIRLARDHIARNAAISRHYQSQFDRWRASFTERQ